MLGWVVSIRELGKLANDVEINTIAFSRKFNMKSVGMHINFVYGLNIANIELTKPPKLTMLMNGTLRIFANTEYNENVLK